MDQLIIGFESLIGYAPLLALIGGVIYGIIAGALPGLSPSSAVALLVPFSYGMEPSSAIILLTAAYIASNYGGSITAIIINSPGTPAAAVTAIDGYILTKKGKANSALFMALASSAVGGFIGVIVLILFAIPLADVALAFGPAEYFALAILGLSTVASMGSNNILKALLAIVLGLLIKTIGTDPISGVDRFTGGIEELYDGFNLIPALIGLFALSGVFEKLTEKMGEKKEHFEEKLESGNSLLEVWKYRASILRSSLIGTIIGIFPGAGATIASFISYDVAKKRSKTPEAFGKGSLEGVAAAEGANSSSVGGALIPLLALGIPGSATDAVLIGAFALHDLTPGPMLFETNAQLVYGVFAALLVANLAILLFGWFGNRYFAKVASLPEPILFTLIATMSVIGSYSVNSSLFDVGACFGFGLLGWVLKKNQFPVPPVVLGIVLSKMIEENFRRALLMDGTASFLSPLTLSLFALTILSFGYPIIKKVLLKNSAK